MRHYGLHIIYYNSSSNVSLLPRHYKLTDQTTHHPRAKTIIPTTDGSQQLPFTTDNVLPPPQRRRQNTPNAFSASAFRNMRMCSYILSQCVQCRWDCSDSNPTCIFPLSNKQGPHFFQ